MTDLATDKFDPKESVWVIKDADPADDVLTNGPYKTTVHLDDEDISVIAGVLHFFVMAKKIPRFLAEDLSVDVAEVRLVNLAYQFGELNHQICQNTIQRMERIVGKKLRGTP